jgi:hypothetical protein
VSLQERERDPADEREEIRAFVSERAEASRPVEFSDEVGRAPAGPARGWRGRERKAKNCELCEGDLWIEDGNGKLVPCQCRSRRASRQVNNRLRAGAWWHGTSLSFAAPPLAITPAPVRDAVEALCADVKNGGDSPGLWIVGAAGTGKSALCAYIAQRLYPTNDAVVERMGNLFAHLRWLGAVKGELAVDRRMQQLAEVPLLALDDIDRAVRSRPPSSDLALRESCASQDLIRLATLLRERRAAELPTVATSRTPSVDCAERTAAITRSDLVRGLLAVASGETSPFEDFPGYTTALLSSAMRELQEACIIYRLDSGHPAAAAA